MPQIKNPSSWGLVLPGGGTRSSFQVGALFALYVSGVSADMFGVGVATSGGGAPLSFSLARRYGEMLRWPWLFDNRRFISLLRLLHGYPMNVTFLVREILQRQAPGLDTEVRQARTKRYIGATDLSTGTPYWFTSSNPVSVFDQMEATKTMSGVSSHYVEIDGTPYADGCFTISTEDCVRKAFEEGAERVLLIDNSSHGEFSPATRALIRWNLRKASASIRETVNRYTQRSSSPLEGSDRLWICRIDDLAVRHGLGRNSRHLEKAIQQGYFAMAKLLQS